MTKIVHGIKIGSEVIIAPARLEPETNTLLVYVKNKKGKPIEGASITVMPGTSAETDASGFAKTTHKQQPGDYITVIVNADGYKSQQKQVMAGQNRKTYGGFGAVKSPEDEVNFILESSVGTKPLVVEVVDNKDNKPINGALVTLKVITTGAQNSAITKGEGEASFTINIGEELRAMVKCKGYKEKWSDITADLTGGGDNAERRFLIYLTKEKEEENADWNGNFIDNYSNFNFTSSAGSVSASWNYAVSDSKGTGSLSSTKLEGNKASGTWTVQHQDDTKTGSRSGTFTLSLSGNTITGELKKDTPNWNYKPGYSAANVNSSMKKGAVWSINISRKK